MSAFCNRRSFNRHQPLPIPALRHVSLCSDRGPLCTRRWLFVCLFVCPKIPSLRLGYPKVLFPSPGFSGLYSHHHFEPFPWKLLGSCIPFILLSGKRDQLSGTLVARPDHYKDQRSNIWKRHLQAEGGPRMHSRVSFEVFQNNTRCSEGHCQSVLPTMGFEVFASPSLASQSWILHFQRTWERGVMGEICSLYPLVSATALRGDSQRTGDGGTKSQT